MYRTILNIAYEPIMFRKVIDNDSQLPYKIKSQHTSVDEGHVFIEIQFKVITKELKTKIDSVTSVSELFNKLKELRS